MGKEYSGIKLVRVLFIPPIFKVASLHLRFIRDTSIVAVVAENRNRTDGRNGWNFSPISLYNLKLIDKTQRVVWASSVVQGGIMTHERQFHPS